MCHPQSLVLVVDDDAAIRDSLADLLLDEGYAVLTAVNGEEALTRLLSSTARPCVILLDLMMPVMSGEEFYRQMRADPQLANTPVVVISADGNVKDKAEELGGEYLRKPVRIDPMLAKIEQHCA
jgi:CheY-like chemotaxis protein